MKYLIHLFLACYYLGVNTVSANEKVTLQLKWHHQFQFAGYYVAKELGYYSELGLDVDLQPVSNGQNPIETVLKGSAEYGIGSSDLVILRAQGKPVVALGVIFQHSPYILLALQKNGIHTIADLKGRRVMIDPYAAEVVAYLKYLGLYPDKIKSISSNDYYPSDLIDGKVDAYAGYITNDPYYLEQQQIPYLAFTPQSEGIDFYGDTLYTLQKEIDEHPERTSAFLQASLKGWRYAIDHPEATVDLIIERGYVQANERDKLLFEAKKTQKLVASKLVNIGYMNPARWQYIADIYVDLGMIPKKISLDGFLYSDEKKNDYRLLWILGGLSCLGVVAIFFSTHLYSLNRRLKLNFKLHRAKNLSKLRNQAKDLRNLHYIDELTGLPNLKMFKGWLDSLLNKSEKAGNYAVLYLDFDNFKAVNNTYSHKVGDEVLLEMTSRIQSQLREKSRFAHVSADKFIILVTGLSDDRDQVIDELNIFTNTIIESIRTPFDIENVKHYLTVSIGTILCPPYAADSATLIKEAELAMFEAKRQGGDKMIFFDPQLQASIEESSQLETQLHNAITNGQLELYYQVQVSYDLVPIGAEALIRWNHPDRGIIPPGVFIPIAENSSLIIEIGNWVLDDACRQLSLWKAKDAFKDLTIAINISADHFCSPEFVERVVNKLKYYEVKPENLELEITESVAATDIKSVINRMSTLRKDHLIRLSLDDFGTGYSSLSYLKNLPINQLKIDQSFIRNLNNNKDNAIMVKAIMNLAANFSLDVIAEGVETDAELAFLSQSGYGGYQGYFFSKPLPIKEFEELISEWAK